MVLRSQWVKTHWFLNVVCRVKPALKDRSRIAEGTVRNGTLERYVRRLWVIGLVFRVRPERATFEIWGCFVGGRLLGEIEGVERQVVDGDVGDRGVVMVGQVMVEIVGGRRQVRVGGGGGRRQVRVGGTDGVKNGVGFLVDIELHKNVIEVIRHNDRIMVLRLVLGEELVAVVCAYAPQVGLGDQEKREFWDCLDAVVGAIPREERIVIGGDFNGHIGKDSDGFPSVHGGFGFGDRNEPGKDLLEFAVAHDLGILNSFFRKRESHLITFSSGGHNTQVDYILMRRGDRRWWMDCKVIPGEQVVAQHRLLVADIVLKHKLTNTKMDLLSCSNDEDRVRLRDKYKTAKREAKMAVTQAKNTTYKMMYESLETKEGEHHMFKIAKARERRRQDLGVVKFIKGDDGRVLVNELDIRLRWQNYFHNLFNGRIDYQQQSENPTIQRRQRHSGYDQSITHGEVRTTLRKMGRAKAIGLDNIPIETWLCLGEEGVQWLQSLFNLIFSLGKMPDQWRRSVVVPLYKNKGDAQCRENYRGIKLLSHTMKLWERIIETRIRRETQVTVNQFCFMPGRSTTEAIHILRRLIEKYREKKRDLHMVFIDLEKAYDSVPRGLIWDSLESRGLPGKYIDIIKDMYDGTETSVRAPVGDTSFFPVEIGLHQGSALSPFLFAVVLDELSKSIQEPIPWCMLFADDIVLVAETKQRLNERLEEWRVALEGKGLRISRSKTDYLHCDFSGTVDREDTQITIDSQAVPQVTKFKYLGSFVQKDGEIDSDVSHRIQAGWCRWRAAAGVLCDRRFPTKLKGKFYKVAVRPAMLYGTDCWAIKKTQTRKMEVAEMRMLRWMCGHTRLERMRNEVFRERLGVASISSKIKEGRLRCLHCLLDVWFRAGGLFGSSLFIHMDRADFRKLAPPLTDSEKRIQAIRLLPEIERSFIPYPTSSSQHSSSNMSGLGVPRNVYSVVQCAYGDLRKDPVDIK
ncbi:uncharacterized protein LOC110869960 [Helianthus annuus]|uniref:uncharacterized protein LOC110869960 n=1 Tax=Helianthus annuus TaxID=4232 RepID=UPI000B8FF8A8|nr:uncharacterized protein LOC110869960 [Helianthus annuus]